MHAVDSKSEILNSLINRVKSICLFHVVIVLSVFSIELTNYSNAQPLEFASATSLYAAHTFSKHLRYRAPKTIFLAFEANFEGDHVDLDWAMVPNTHLASITVEKSKNKRKFLEVVTLNAPELLKGAKSYKAADNNPWRKVTYYRLKATDKFGNCSYSSVTNIKLKKSNLMDYNNFEITAK